MSAFFLMYDIILVKPTRDADLSTRLPPTDGFFQTRHSMVVLQPDLVLLFVQVSIMLLSI